MALKTFITEPFTRAKADPNLPNGSGPIVQEDADVIEESQGFSESEVEPSSSGRRMASDEIVMERLAESENEVMEVEES